LSNLQVFKNKEFGQVRGKLIDGQPYVVLTDVCKILGLNNVSQVKARLKKDGVITNEVIDSLGRKQIANFIDESNLYRVIFQSRKKEAEKFTDWVVEEVLPSIRKHGAYMTPEKIEEVLMNPDTIIQLATQLKEERALVQKQKQIIGELKPKADYMDRILKNKGLVTITQIAKDYGMSGQAMNKLLNDLGVQYKQSGQWLLYREHHGKGYTHSETVEIIRSDGREDVKMNTKWTQKGRLFLYELLKENGVLPVIEKPA
jgi:anti-repressor protein